jgi:hypothetical protein
MAGKMKDAAPFVETRLPEVNSGGDVINFRTPDQYDTVVDGKIVARYVPVK